MNPQIQYDYMTTTPIPRLIMTLAVPTTITMLVTNLYNLADTYFVSQLGTSASGAIGIVYALMAILQALGFLLGQGAGSNISRRLGAKDYESASRFASTSFFLSLLFSIILCITGLTFLEPFMKLLGSTDTILPYSRNYGTYILLAAPAMMTSFTMNNILRFEGKATFAMIGLTTGGILNIIGDPLLMFKCGMGISGAGLSTLISQYISAAILLSMFLRGKTQCKLSLGRITHKCDDILNILYTGSPSLLRQGLGSLSTLLLNKASGVYGDGAIAAMSIVSRCMMLLFCVGLGIGQGFQPVVGFNYGAKQYRRVKAAFKFTLCFGIGMIGLFALGGLIFSADIIGWFSKDKEVIEIALYAFRLQCITLFIIPISVCGNMLFQSIGKSGTALFLSSLRNGVCLIPLLLIFPLVFGIRGLQWSQPLADIGASFITIPFVWAFFKRLSD